MKLADLECSALAKLIIPTLWWYVPPFRAFSNWQLSRPRGHRSSGFSPAVDEQRLLSIRWRADRNWGAWHVEDIRFLLYLLDKENNS